MAWHMGSSMEMVLMRQRGASNTVSDFGDGYPSGTEAATAVFLLFCVHQMKDICL